MTAKHKIHQLQLNEWAARFSEQKASGLTARQWCEQNSLSIHKYNYRKHILKEEAVDQLLPDIVPLPIPGSVMPPVPDTSHHNDPVSTSSDCRSHSSRANCANRATFTTPNVRLCIDGVAIEIESSVSEEFLRTLVRAVHYA